MYPEELVRPMRQELVSAGFKELYTSNEVEEAIKKEGTTLVMVNSVFLQYWRKVEKCWC